MSNQLANKPPKVSAPAESAAIHLVDDHHQNLAIEMAAELETPREILKRYGMKTSDFKVLAKTEKFKQQFKDAKIAWGSSLNAKERVSLKSAMISEGSLLRINQIIHDKDTPPSNVIEAHKHVSNLGAVMPSKAGESDGASKHSIVINIGRSQGREPITVEGNVVEHSDE